LLALKYPLLDQDAARDGGFAQAELFQDGLASKSIGSVMAFQIAKTVATRRIAKEVAAVVGLAAVKRSAMVNAVRGSLKTTIALRPALTDTSSVDKRPAEALCHGR